MDKQTTQESKPAKVEVKQNTNSRMDRIGPPQPTDVVKAVGVGALAVSSSFLIWVCLGFALVYYVGFALFSLPLWC